MKNQQQRDDLDAADLEASKRGHERMMARWAVQMRERREADARSEQRAAERRYREILST